MSAIEQSAEGVIIPADALAGPQQGHWTYEEYAALPADGRRYEVMDGVLLMAPSPSPAHQNVVKWLTFYWVYEKVVGKQRKRGYPHL